MKKLVLCSLLSMAMMPGLASANVVTTDVVQSKTIASWDDSHNLHSTDLYMDGFTLKTRVTMKKLAHRIELHVNAPVDVAGIARDHLNKCVDAAVNSHRTRRLVELLSAIGVDVWAGGGGAASAAFLASYISEVVDSSMECLSNAGVLAEHIKESLAGQFSAYVHHHSDWVYWNL